MFFFQRCEINMKNMKKGENFIDLYEVDAKIFFLNLGSII